VPRPAACQERGELRSPCVAFSVAQSCRRLGSFLLAEVRRMEAAFISSHQSLRQSSAPALRTSTSSLPGAAAELGLCERLRVWNSLVRAGVGRGRLGTLRLYWPPKLWLCRRVKPGCGWPRRAACFVLQLKEMPPTAKASLPSNSPEALDCS